MKSMTGYAKRSVTVGERKITVEIKTLNSKQMDVAVKMPQSVRSHELEVRALLAPLERGKVDVVISEESATMNAVGVDVSVVESRYAAAKALATRAGIAIGDADILKAVLQCGDVWQQDNGEEMTVSEWTAVENCVRETVADVDDFRRQEGEVMCTDILSHVDMIETMLAKIEPYEKERIEGVKERLSVALDETGARVDSERFEQELVYYLEKLDITEEKVRLAKHINYFRDVVKSESTCGKKLSFVTQEMGREINTTGSKANHVEIQRIVVVMKDELEKIKEQLGNIL